MAGGASAGGWRRGALTADGAAAGAMAGTIMAAGGWRNAVAMLALFLTGSALSRGNGTATPEAEMWEKGNRRDAGQVLANGGVAVLAAAFAAFRPGQLSRAACFGALAASNADTWSTELGVRAAGSPRRITDWRIVPRGESGGVTARGLVGGMAGAALIAALGASPQSWVRQGAGIAVAGLCGSLADSVLGATVQALYECPRCHTFTEQPRHRCGAVAELRRGQRWITNDIVNLLATAVGAVVALGWEWGTAECGSGSAASATP